MESYTDRKTIQDLERIIERCLNESEQAGDIKTLPKLGDHKVLVNRDEVIRHISKTIIGELFEFEIIRKLAPTFRQFRSLERDLFYIEERESAASEMNKLRVDFNAPKNSKT
jgi:hypothetical protein